MAAYWRKVGRNMCVSRPKPGNVLFIYWFSWCFAIAVRPILFIENLPKALTHVFLAQGTSVCRVAGCRPACLNAVKEPSGDVYKMP